MGKKQYRKPTPEEKRAATDIVIISRKVRNYFFALLSSHEKTVLETVTALAQFNSDFIDRLSLMAEEEDRELLKEDIVFRLKAGLDYFILNKHLPKN